MGFLCPKKEIIYRGGVVRFFIPKHWNEEYEKDGGGTFYESGDNTGTLRVNVISFLTKKDAPSDWPMTILKDRSINYSGQIEELAENRYMLKYSASFREAGEDLLMFRWEVGKMVSPRDCNIAAFGFAVTAAQSQSSSILHEISSIEAEIKEVRFGMHGDSY